MAEAEAPMPEHVEQPEETSPSQMVPDGGAVEGEAPHESEPVAYEAPAATEDGSEDPTANRKLFVGNLPSHVKEPDLMDFFAKYPPVSFDIKQNYAFVIFDTEEKARAALEMNGVELQGKKITVQQARAKNKARRNGTSAGNACFECGEEGHWARECPKKRGGRRPPPRRRSRSPRRPRSPDRRGPPRGRSPRGRSPPRRSPPRGRYRSPPRFDDRRGGYGAGGRDTYSAYPPRDTFRDPRDLRDREPPRDAYGYRDYAPPAPAGGGYYDRYPPSPPRYPANGRDSFEARGRYRSRSRSPRRLSPVGGPPRGRYPSPPRGRPLSPLPAGGAIRRPIDADRRYMPSDAPHIPLSGPPRARDAPPPAGRRSPVDRLRY